MRQQIAAGVPAASSSPYVGDNSVEYFEPPSRLQLLDKLHHLVRFSDFLLVVQGDAGSGKSSLLRQLRPQTGDGRLCHLVLQQATGASTLLRLLGEGCGLDVSDCETDGHLLELIHREAQYARDAGMQWLLVVDDADRLDNDALELLVNLQRAGITSIRTVLAGRDIVQRLQTTGLAQELEGRMHRESLQPFSDDEAGDFIRLRYPALEVLDSRKLQQLVNSSDRMPGSLELLASKALRLKSPMPAKLPRARRDKSGLVLGGASLMLVVIVAMAGWIYWQPESTSGISERVSVPLAVPVIAASVDQPVMPINVIEARPQFTEQLRVQVKDAVLPAASDADRSDRQDLDVLVDSTRPAVPVFLPALSAQDLFPDTRETIPVTQAVAQPAVRGSAQPNADLVEVIVAAEPTLAPKPEPGMVEVAARTPPSSAVKENAVKESIVNESAGAKPLAAAAKSAATALPQVVEMDGGGELLSWPDKGYTLQLLGARQLETARGFIADQQDPAAFHYFSTLYKGKPWHVVIIGRFGSRKEASAGVQELPASLQKLKPWARSIQSVKADIRKVPR
uniref:AAA family ATPase n=1 Tax=Marinobacterium profundum TaxID=1714300 RepID=UPI00082DF85D|nr:AAA family ATPase [Marinobacterium profundum]